MAAPVSETWAGDLDTSNPHPESLGDATSLEVGMSGMSLLTTLDADHRRKNTGSTVSTSPDDHDQSSARGSAPPSPINDRATLKSQSRPPGLSGLVPSPIGKQGNSKTTSATSPSLTLTPNSPIDGHSDWSAQASPYQDPPSLPFLQPEHRRSQNGSYGSTDFSDVSANSEGFMYLGALRERAYSSPSVTGSSPPIGPRGHLSAHMPQQQQQQQQYAEQEKLRPRDRPPRSQPYDGYSSQGERSTGGGSTYSKGDVDSTFGTIGRPELRQSATEFDPSRLRSSSVDNYSFGQMLPDQVSQKFGTLPTLGSHIQQQHQQLGYQPDFSNLQKPRHVRSVSQPVAAGFGGQLQQQVPHGIDPRFFGGDQTGHTSRHSFSMSGSSYNDSGNAVTRSASMSQTMLATSYDSGRYGHKGASVPNLGAYQQQQHHGSYRVMQRRDAHDYQEDTRSFGGPSMISPGHSPHQMHYGGHSRQPSDPGVSMLSSSPISIGSGGMRVSGGSIQHARHPSHNEEDFAHPLMGENIEVPADHDDHAIHGGQYMVNHGGHHPLIRGPPAHVQSLSMDQIPPQYIEAPHHLPTAGAMSPPKVIYNVKFKRTQRNFVLGPRISRDLKIGTYVKVEADRGEDLGIVVGKAAVDKFGFSARSSFTAGMGPPGGIGSSSPADMKRVVRLATHDEVALLSLKRDEEEELLKICRAKVRQRGLPMHVVDAEYQFDRHKLTFFFEAEGRVDFRELVRDLFSMYKTRIWMQQLDKHTSTSAPAIVAPQMASLQMDYGTPIIAPVSEFADSLVLNGLGGHHE